MIKVSSFISVSQRPQLSCDVGSWFSFSDLFAKSQNILFYHQVPRTVMTVVILIANCPGPKLLLQMVCDSIVFATTPHNSHSKAWWKLHFNCGPKHKAPDTLDGRVTPPKKGWLLHWCFFCYCCWMFVSLLLIGNLSKTDKHLLAFSSGDFCLCHFPWHTHKLFSLQAFC